MKRSRLCWIILFLIFLTGEENRLRCYFILIGYKKEEKRTTLVSFAYSSFWGICICNSKSSLGKRAFYILHSSVFKKCTYAHFQQSSSNLQIQIQNHGPVLFFWKDNCVQRNICIYCRVCIYELWLWLKHQTDKHKYSFGEQKCRNLESDQK